MPGIQDGRALRILIIIDEYTRECLSIYVARRIKHQDVLDQLYDLFISRGTPEHIRSDNASEFTAKVAGKSRSNDPVHRAWEAMGKWLCGVIHW